MGMYHSEKNDGWKLLADLRADVWYGMSIALPSEWNELYVVCSMLDYLSPVSAYLADKHALDNMLRSGANVFQIPCPVSFIDTGGRHPFIIALTISVDNNLSVSYETWHDILNKTSTHVTKLSERPYANGDRQEARMKVYYK